MNIAVLPLSRARRDQRTGISGVHLFLGALLAVIVFLTVLPLAILLLASLRPPPALPFDPVPFTLTNYARVYADPTTYGLFANTAVYGLLALAFGLTCAASLAWLTERTDLPLKGLFSIGMMLQMVMPGVVIAMSWILLAGPRQGLLNVGLRQIFNLSGDGPLNVYTFAGLVIVTGFGIMPTIFVMLVGLMRNMDPTLEEAASASGADFMTTVRRVTLPLLRPGLLSVILFFSMVMLEAFDVALVIGLSFGFPVLSTRVYALTQGSQGQVDYGAASSFATLGLILGIVLVLSYLRATRNAGKYSTVTGKAFRPKQVSLGVWRWPVCGVVLAFFIVQVVLPLVTVVWNSLLPFYQPPSVKALQSLSMRAYSTVFLEDARIPGVLANTLWLTVGTASVCMVLSSAASWVVVRSKGPLPRYLDLVTFLPTAIPGIVLALAFLLAAVGTPLYGTVMLIMLAQVVRYLPFGTRTMNGAQIQIHRELEEAAAACGAGGFTTYRKVLFPLLVAPFVNGWLWVATHSIRDVTIPLILVSLNNMVIASLLWEYWGWGKTPEASAIAVMLLSVTLLVSLPALRWASGTRTYPG